MMKGKQKWVVYIGGMCLPWEDGLMEEEAKKYAEAFKNNGVHASAHPARYSSKTRRFGSNVAKVKENAK